MLSPLFTVVVVGFFFFCCDRFLKEEVGMAEVGCGSWLGLVFGSLVVVWFGVWVVAEVGCWSSEIASIGVRRGHREISVGHHMVGWFFWVSDGFIYLFIIIIFFNMGFCSGGILVSSGQWWRGGHVGGAVVMTGQWRYGDRG